MENHFNTPAEVVDLSIKACENKTKLPVGKMILLGIMAGGFYRTGRCYKQHSGTRSRKCRSGKSIGRCDLSGRIDADRILRWRTFYRKLSDHYGRI